LRKNLGFILIKSFQHFIEAFFKRNTTKIEREQMSYNKNFKMDLQELDIVETSLQHRVNYLSKATGSTHLQKNVSSEITQIREVLGKLHNQKNWYRPKNKVYVGG